LQNDPRLALPECWYWIRKLQARVYSADYVSAIKAASKAQELLWTSPSFFEMAEYHFYGALARAGHYDEASADERHRHLEALSAHHMQLDVWAQNCPENFANRAALVAAEIARIEGRDLDAMHFYEEAIRSARANDFVHNEALANELAGRFYAARGFQKIAHAYLHDARYCYLRWGADGKVRQLDQLYPHIREGESAPGPTSTIGAPTENLDLATVIKVSQAVSGEIVLEKLIDTLMRTALQHAGAQRGLLIAPHGGAPRVEAEATTNGDTITVQSRQASVSAADLPDSVLHYVVRTQESVILDDASAQSAFAADAYIRRNRVRSVLCLPLIRQTALIGVLYLENNLTPRVFTPSRSAVLKLIASQAAISLENAYLYIQRKRAEEVQRVQEREREELQRQLQQASKMEAMGRLAGGIAHDFNNILGAILGYGELAQNNLREDSAVRHQVDQVMHAGARGKELVDRILAFSRSGMGERLPLRVQSVVEETLELLAASLPADVHLETRLHAIDTAVVGDATQFHQVVMNLCTNAVHAMEKGGALTVVLESVAVGERLLLSHGALDAGHYLRLSVGDTGGGIPPTVLARMFDPFFTTKRVGEGTGLGLALVHGIVADFGGVIDVATQVGVGTTFTIWLPASDEMPRLLAEPAGELPRGNGETVMIVDDERALVALAEETLAELGYEPVGFDSGVAALQAFRAEPKRFELVLTDETMPDLTGTELAREIRQLRPDISIILMSGYSGTQLSERAQAAGVVDVLRKPLVRRDIAEPVARALLLIQSLAPMRTP
jgi:signal transduction histidine kinase/ActR/RegA family two-component response regulator